MIYTITLNTAIDRIIKLDNPLHKKHNNKVISKTYDIGGKATHVSVVLSALGIDNRALGVIGGQTGETLVKLMKNKKVICDFINQENVSTRESIVVVDNKNEGSYMITEKGFPISEKSFNKLLKILRTKVEKEDFVVICGSPPKGFPLKNFNELLSVVKEKTNNLYIDTSGIYLKESLKHKPIFIKPNQFEFSELVGKELTSINEYINEIEKFINLGIENIVVSLGKDGSLICNEGEIYKITPPKIKEVNDTGCGDVFVGGFVSQKSLKKSTLDSVIFATAISCSKATKNDSSSFDLLQTNEFIKKIKIEKI